MQYSNYLIKNCSHTQGIELHYSSAIGSAKLANGAPPCPIPLGATVTQIIRGEDFHNRKRNWIMPHVLSHWGCIWREAGTLVSQQPLEGCVWAQTGFCAASITVVLTTAASARSTRDQTSAHSSQGRSVLGYRTYWVCCTYFSPDEMPNIINFNVLCKFQSVGTWLHRLHYLVSIY